MGRQRARGRESVKNPLYHECGASSQIRHMHYMVNQSQSPSQFHMSIGKLPLTQLQLVCIYCFYFFQMRLCFLLEKRSRVVKFSTSSPGCVCVCVCLDCIQQSFYDLLQPDMAKDFPRCCTRKMAHLTRLELPSEVKCN